MNWPLLNLSVKQFVRHPYEIRAYVAALTLLEHDASQPIDDAMNYQIPRREFFQDS